MATPLLPSSFAALDREPAWLPHAIETEAEATMHQRTNPYPNNARGSSCPRHPDDELPRLVVHLAARRLEVRDRELVPEEKRSILELKAEGYSSKDIGERLGISERTVQRVLEELRRRMETEWETGE